MLRLVLVSQRPRILGLTAAVFRKKCKPYQIDEIIQDLSQSMNAVVKIPNDVQAAYQLETNN